MSKSKKQRKNAMIQELALDMILGAWQPEEDEDLESWAARVAKSISYNKHSGKTRLTADDVKLCRLLAMMGIEQFSNGATYYDPRTNTSVEVSKTSNG